MQPQFELSFEPLLKSGLGSLARYGTHQKTISEDRSLNRSIFYLTRDWNGLRRGLYAFISFKLPILTGKSLNITLLPRKSEKRSKRETS